MKTKNEIRLQHKATALNEIRKIYNFFNYEKGIGLRHNSWDESWAEQRDALVYNIIKELEKKLFDLK